jgi:glutathione S-transferase
MTSGHAFIEDLVCAMLTLYAIPPSLYCAKLRIVLRHKGLEWTELPPPGGYGSAEYKTHVPSGNLPALRDGDLLLADSEAIAEYLNDKHPMPPMLPADPQTRAKARERSRFHDTRLEPAVRALFPYLPGRGDAPAGFLTSQAETINARLTQLGQMLSDTPDAGMELTLAECGYPITLAWLDAIAQPMDLAITMPKSVIAYRAKAESHTAVADELAQYRPILATFLGQ